ncbi:MAG: DUF1189 family protein [Candidatus Moraniibacteriota bacterium]|nr:MAG: DUF1189 family protein [Candidatus Moranbacteria bacterium]
MIERIKDIFYRPNFFRAQTFTFGQSLHFYSLTVLCFVVMAVLSMLPSAVTVIQSIRSGEWQVQKSIVAGLYPDDLTLTVNRDTVTTNQAGPVVIPLPEAWRAMAECDMRRCVREELPANLLVIDTKQPINQSDFAELDTVAILGAQEVGFHNPDRGETRIFNLKEAGFNDRLIVTPARFAEWVERGFAVARTGLLVLMFFMPALMYLGVWIAYLLYALFGALVVWIAASIRKQQLTYGRAYLSTLYLLPAPLAFCFLLTATSAHVPLLFTLVLFLVALTNFPKAEAFAAPVKITPADSSALPKDVEVEPASASDGEKPAEEAPKEEKK